MSRVAQSDTTAAAEMATSNSLELPSLRGLHTTEQMELLDIVDSLRAQGLSEFTPLPQLIVCGDQSSGKSSVLEALSGVPFPRNENLCTRFATEVILRRAATNGISVSIVPAKEKSSAEQSRLQQFRHHIATREGFFELFEKAKDAIDLSNSVKGFSRDILRVEIFGPTQPQLTLVDLPGLIHSETKSQTTQDIELVSKLVAEYMKYPRSIILAVVSAKNDIGNQIVLRRAREVDPQGKRTLGIITKPDTLSKGSGAEAAFLGLARNDDVKFELGWHVVKNLDTSIKGSSTETRDEQENAFFKESSFKNLSSHSTGIAALRTRLSKVLFNQIRLELPRLIEDIGSKTTLTQSELDKLGPSRSTVEQQRAFLIDLSQSFQIICRDAIRGDYEHPFFQDDTNCNKRLCANLMNMHFAFAENLRTNGSRWTISDQWTANGRSRTREEAVNEAQKLLKRSRGRELPGLPNPLLVGALFREYSSPWEGLGREHIQRVWEATNKFLDLVLQYLANPDIGDAVFSLWLSPIMDQRLQAAYTKLDELTAVHKDHPMTTNHYFLDNVKKLQQRETKEELGEKLKKSFTQANGTLSIDDVAAILSAAGPKTSPDMDLVAASDAFDNMQAYYKVAMKLFMDNVPSLAIQAPIVREVPSMFCPTAVCSMDADVVTRIAGESDEKSLYREELLRQLNILNAGARICKQYAIRPKPVSKEAEKSIASHAKQPLSSTVQSMSTMSISSNTLGNDQGTGINWSTLGSLSKESPSTSTGLFGGLSKDTKASSLGLSNGDLFKTTPSTTTLFGVPVQNSPASSGLSGGDLLKTTPSTTPLFRFPAQPPPATSGSSSGGLFKSTPSTTSAFGFPTQPTPTSSSLAASTKGSSSTSSIFGNLSQENALASDKVKNNAWSVTSSPESWRVATVGVMIRRAAVRPDEIWEPFEDGQDMFHNIAKAKKYQRLSFEEIRWKDYGIPRRFERSYITCTAPTWVPYSEEDWHLAGPDRTEKQLSGQAQYTCISAVEKYRQFSFEELRLADYMTEQSLRTWLRCKAIELSWTESTIKKNEEDGEIVPKVRKCSN